MNALARVFALDLRSIALFRIGVAVALLLDCITRAIDVRAFLTDEGVFPRALWFKLAQRSPELWSFHIATGSSMGALVLLAISAALALALLLGWRARTVAIASLVLLVSLHNRNPQVFYGFDLMIRVSLLWLCFLPLSARWSFDAKLHGDGGSDDNDDTGHPDGAQHVSPGTVALTLQMIMIYAFSATQKLQDESWRSLDAVWLGLTTDNHATAAARWLAGSYEVTRALSLLVLVLELCVPLLLLVPVRGRARDLLRIGVVTAFVLFHVGTAIFFELGLFPLAGIVAWLPFLPARVWDRAADNTRELTFAKRRAVAAVVGALVVVILASNLESVTQPFLPSPLRRLAAIARVEQNWNMYERAMVDGWFLVRGTRDNGASLDVLHDGAPITLEKPAHVADTFSSMRWRKYITGLVRPSGTHHRAAFLHNLCDQWRRATGERLVTVDLVMMQETEHPARPSIVTMRTLASVPCR